MIQIIAGEFRGRKLKTPKSQTTRPTTSMLRKALFDICKAHLLDAEVLDLFAGSGAIGFEALSRGAKHVTLIDTSPLAIACIKENAQLLGVENKVSVWKADVFAALKQLKRKEATFDLIYIDPPYGRVSIDHLIIQMDEYILLNKGGTLFIEEPISSQTDLNNTKLQRLRYYDTRRFGKTLLHQFMS